MDAAERAARLQACIAALETGRDDLRHHCKCNLEALPVHATLVYLWAIRPDGVVLCIDHEAFARPSEPETDQLRIYAAWKHAARTHKELAEFVPQPPGHAEPCAHCAGRGRSEQESYCFSCSGIGWVLR